MTGTFKTTESANVTVNCMLCKQSGTAIDVLSRKLRDDDSGRYSVARCASCGFVQLAPMPSEQAIANYYNRDMQPKALWPDSDYYAVLERKAEQDNVRRRQWLEGCVPPGDGVKVIDAGCGYGFFINELTAYGYHATGLDLSEDRIELARMRKKGEFVLGSLTDDFVGAHQGHFDAAMSFHAVEHMPNPTDGIRSLMAVVKPGGYVLVEVPNIDDELIDQISEYADHQWQFGHLGYFDKSHLELAARQAGARTFDVAGVQRYGLEHLVTWSRTHAPDLSMTEGVPSTPLFASAEKEYRHGREKRLTCDTLILTIRIEG